MMKKVNSLNSASTAYESHNSDIYSSKIKNKCQKIINSEDS